MSRPHDYYVYILTNLNKTVLYIGVTNSLVRRISQHQRGAVAGFARDYHVTQLIYYEHFREVRDALARESQLKKWSRVKKETLIARMNPGWRNLNDELDEQDTTPLPPLPAPRGN